MTHDLKLYCLLICLPAAVLTGFGFIFIHRQAADDAAREMEIRNARIERLAESLQELVHEKGRTGDVVRVALAGWTGGEGVKSPEGAFVWNYAQHLEWTRGDCAVWPRLAAFSRWNEWTALGKKHAKRGLMDLDGTFVLWGRVGDAVYGVVFDGHPLGTVRCSMGIWMVGGILMVLLACVFGAGAWLMVRAAAKARRDDQTKTTFLSNCSHELKTPLAGIGIWADLLQSGRTLTDEKRQHAYDVIVRENARMVRLVENLLDFSRLEQGRRKYQMEDVDLAVLAAECIELVRGKFEPHGVDLKTSGDVHAHADVDAVKQILMNLLGNAAKYAAADGPVEVVVSAENGTARIVVADRGPGMSAEAMSHAFERFYRADDELTAKTGGLGLGLSISRALARGMGGELSVAARDGGGCLFALELRVGG